MHSKLEATHKFQRILPKKMSFKSKHRKDFCILLQKTSPEPCQGVRKVFCTYYLICYYFAYYWLTYYYTLITFCSNTLPITTTLLPYYVTFHYTSIIYYSRTYCL